MKILFFADVHYDKTILKKLVSKGKDCDILVCCGDISTFGGGLKESLKVLKETKKKILIVHGNHETTNEIRSVCDGKNVIFMHKKLKEFGDVLFCGYGGDGFSFNDERLDDWVKSLKEKFKGKKLVLFTHATPYGTKLDDLPGIGHKGSMSVRNAIKILKPIVYSCGHFHETFFVKDTLGKSKLINPGDEGMVIEI